MYTTFINIFSEPNKFNYYIIYVGDDSWLMIPMESSPTIILLLCRIRCEGRKKAMSLYHILCPLI